MPNTITSAHSAFTAGIHAAVVLPYRSDYSLDENGYRRQLEFIMGHEGITGLLVNGHAGENSLTSDEEKERVVRLTREVVPSRIMITSGVYSESSENAVRQAVRLEKAGSDALLVFQPNSWALGAEPSSILTHHRMIHDAVTTPLMFYQAPVNSGKFAYSFEVIRELVGLERVRGVKDGSWEIAMTELVRDEIKARRPDITVYGSGDEHLLVNYLIGTEGSQVSLAAVIPGLICDLWASAQAQDWSRAKALHQQIQPLATLIYRNAPASRAVARLKACLTILGVIESDSVRPPLATVPKEELALLERALQACKAPVPAHA
ncbi:dihydrodipicolinate synthase family protein [Agaricicola taiwanensis]|uniref:Dihydrodipicolinate synthase family protein n=1 Tax=Agaricicola taiwanensis TaxID=591372 RepID=A0A8J2VNQ3_9RHOB|nr:dihydrodipicolinate synthase family protein [Agaricicola taiwanensis]GGE41217.1 dihydrodipicolinate synthase family protein [Agaricicola taiwanensis]